MAKNVFDILNEKAKRRDNFNSSEEGVLFNTYRNKLLDFPKYSFLYEKFNDFDIIRSCIIIQGIKNRITIEKTIAEYPHDLENVLKSLPYMDYQNSKIYVPFFSKEDNDRLIKGDYSDFEIIDAFDYYQQALYNSFFTRLIKVKDYKNISSAYFHYDTDTIYIINDEGRLDFKIVLFDKYMKRVVHSHMLNRIEPVINAFYQMDREAMIKALFDNKLISETLYKEIKKE